jgi:methionine-S-sulfoxide reductase
MSKHLLWAIAGMLALALSGSIARAQETKTAVFGGGCFWCMQKPYDQTPGVVKTVVGYSGGSEVNPTYNDVAAKKTGHREVIQVTYDPAKVSYDQLLDVFWRQINPTQADGQFADRGLPYKAAVFYANEEEKKLAEASKAKLAASGKFDKPIVTDILGAAPFYAAEDYHQMYYQKNAADYQAYYVGSGRAGFLEKTWGKSTKQ